MIRLCLRVLTRHHVLAVVVLEVLYITSRQTCEDWLSMCALSKYDLHLCPSVRLSVCLCVCLPVCDCDCVSVCVSWTSLECCARRLNTSGTWRTTTDDWSRRTLSWSSLSQANTPTSVSLVCLSVCLCVSVSLSVCLSLCLSVSVYLSVSVCLSVC